MSITCFDSDGNVLKALYQWDNNQTLTVQGLDMPPIPVFHFCNRLSNLALVVTPTVSGTSVTVNIPNILLQQAEPIIAYVYQDTENDGYRTMHAIHIPVIPRPKPDDYEYTDNVDYISVAVLNSRLNTLQQRVEEMIRTDVTAKYTAWTPESGTEKTVANYAKTLTEGGYRITDGQSKRYEIEVFTVKSGEQWRIIREYTDEFCYIRVYCGDAVAISIDEEISEVLVNGRKLLTDVNIPIPTSTDAGKVLTVSDAGAAVWTAVANAEEVAV